MRSRQTQITPLSGSDVQAGFPSPADDFSESGLDLNDYLISHESSTFMVRVSGDSMIEAGMLAGDILVVDRGKNPSHGSIVIAILDGELTVKRLLRKTEGWILKAENSAWRSIPIVGNSQFEVWGVVVGVVRKL
ncbi:MAG: translesion error-prone DNA polymerase V autoproteolytic subunit [Lentisphaeraceae bacterium]|nr:translesion error-prone DNA polymerase V autoproteolytic subunit [Lentisphaeraceae bacterium]